MTQTLTIPACPPTLNQLMRGKLIKRMTLGKAWSLIVCHAVAHQRIVPAVGPRRVSMDVCHGTGRRKPDVDAYLKATLDALANAKAIVDDAYGKAVIGEIVYSRGKTDRTIITLEDLT